MVQEKEEKHNKFYKIFFKQQRFDSYTAFFKEHSYCKHRFYGANHCMKSPSSIFFVIAYYTHIQKNTIYNFK